MPFSALLDTGLNNSIALATFATISTVYCIHIFVVSIFKPSAEQSKNNHTDLLFQYTAIKLAHTVESIFGILLLPLLCVYKPSHVHAFVQSRNAVKEKLVPTLPNEKETKAKEEAELKIKQQVEKINKLKLRITKVIKELD